MVAGVVVVIVVVVVVVVVVVGAASAVVAVVVAVVAGDAKAFAACTPDPAVVDIFLHTADPAGRYVVCVCVAPVSKAMGAPVKWHEGVTSHTNDDTELRKG